MRLLELIQRVGLLALGAIVVIVAFILLVSLIDRHPRRNSPRRQGKRDGQGPRSPGNPPTSKST